MFFCLDSCRVSLTSKKASARTWTFAPCIFLGNRGAADLYASVVPHLGPYTKQISLSNRCPEPKSSIELIEAQCIHLRELEITAPAILLNKHVEATTWARIFARLKKLKIYLIRSASSDGLMLRIGDIVRSATKKMHIELLDIFFAPNSAEAVESLRQTLSQLAPTLSSVRVHMEATPERLENLFSDCTHLELLCGLECFQSMTGDAWNDYSISCVRALASTRVGCSIFFDGPLGSISLLSRWLLSTRQPILAIVDRLQVSGFSQVIHPEVMANLMADHIRLLSAEDFDRFADVLESNANPILPKSDSLRPYLGRTSFWTTAVFLSIPTGKLDRYMRLFGPPLGNLFCSIANQEQLLWYLTTMPKDQTIALLNENSPFDSRRDRIRSLLDNRLVSILLREVEASDFLSFQSMEDFEIIAKSCRDSNVLLAIVNATGWACITPEVRGRILWSLCSRDAQKMDAESSLQLWLDFIVEDIKSGRAHAVELLNLIENSQFPTFLRSVDVASVFRSYLLEEEPSLGLSETLLRIRDPFLLQIAALDLVLKTELLELLENYIDLLKQKHAQPAETLRQQVVLPLVQLRNKDLQTRISLGESNTTTEVQNMPELT
jgi:hypothetical protein